MQFFTQGCLICSPIKLLLVNLGFYHLSVDVETICDHPIITSSSANVDDNLSITG